MLLILLPVSVIDELINCQTARRALLFAHYWYVSNIVLWHINIRVNYFVNAT